MYLLLMPPPQRLVASGDSNLDLLTPLYLPNPGALGYGCLGLQKDTALLCTSVLLWNPNPLPSSWILC